jgi:putative peptide zinc metalloprotease protein
MTAAASASAKSSAPDETVVPPLRGDLIVTRQKYEDRTYYVVKDPVSLQYFRLTAEDYALATLFDGKRPLGKVRAEYLDRFPHIKLDYSAEEIDQRIQRFAADLAMMQFLSVQGQRMKQRADAKKAAKAAKGRFYNLVNRIFFMRFSVYDPDKLFGRMARPLWWIWTRTTMWISIALIAAGIAVFFQNYDRTEEMMANFFHFDNLLLIWVLTILIKSVHELGHGLTCKHFGAEVHEVGVMFLVFTPYFFVNVSDSWTMPNRAHRILVSAAGIYVELIFAAFAVFAWAVVQPGPLQQMLYNIIIIASFSTIVFNANPLMRFDGYYILTDLIEVPNLQQKSRAFVGEKMKQLLFGRSYRDPVLARMPLPRTRLALFYFYAVASYLYGYFVIYNLAIYMGPHLKPLGLEGLADWFSFSALFAWVVMPFVGFFKGLGLNRDDWNPGGRLRRLSVILSLVIGIFGAFCFLPWQLVIKRSVAITLAEPEAVRPQVPGFVTEIYFKEGDSVERGTPLAQLTNREIEQEYIETQQKVRVAETMITRAMGLDRPAELRAAEASRIQAEQRLAAAKRNMENLTLRAAEAGTILTHDLEKRRGQYLKAGELWCSIAPLDSMRIRVPLSEHQVRYVHKGQRVKVKAHAYPGAALSGVIAEDPVTKPLGTDMPPAFSSRRHGDVPTVQHEGKEIPLERTFEAHVVIDNKGRLLREGMTGRAKIYADRKPFGRLLLQSLLDLVSLDYRF